MKYTFILLFISAILCIPVSGQVNKKIVVILAHPDDETAFGQVLYDLSEKNTVILITATDGRYGYREHAGIPKGDSLVAWRTNELKCACKKLRIDSLIQLAYHDGMGMVTGIGEFFRQSRLLREDLTRLIDQLQPDLIISFGPDGDTGHPDHRQVGNLVTEILLQEGWAEKYPLYYFAWNNEAAKVQGIQSSVAVPYLNVAFRFSNKAEKANQAAIQCHWSQFTEKEMQEGFDYDDKDNNNTLYFRKFSTEKGLKNQFE